MSEAATPSSPKDGSGCCVETILEESGNGNWFGCYCTCLGRDDNGLDQGGTSGDGERWMGPTGVLITADVYLSAVRHWIKHYALTVSRDPTGSLMRSVL